MSINAVYQMKIVGPDGTTMYVGGIKLVGEPIDAIAVQTVEPGEAVIPSASSIINPPTAAVGDEELYFDRVAGTTSTPQSVAIEKVLAGKKGLFAPVGSYVPVRNDTAGTIGLPVVSSNARLVKTVASLAQLDGTALGVCFKAQATHGSVSFLGVLISPS